MVLVLVWGFKCGSLGVDVPARRVRNVGTVMVVAMVVMVVVVMSIAVWQFTCT